MNRFAHYEEEAKQDLAEIFDYLDMNSETAADKFYDAVEKTILRLLKSPDLGEFCRFDNPKTEGMRIWRVSGFPNHLIFYRSKDEMLQILRVLHGARDYETIFNEE
ncbi:MAG: type II toxin-antitoxin system RelE/ParE family toxin [Planctomycetaceae bacterium]|nr:type II toxin-antitoxin system RelE/ParE family toxin [Planctomycetaceae bacterium]